MSDHYDQWVEKQELMGRTISPRIVDIPSVYMRDDDEEET